MTNGYKVVSITFQKCDQANVLLQSVGVLTPYSSKIMFLIKKINLMKANLFFLFVKNNFVNCTQKKRTNINIYWFAFFVHWICPSISVHCHRIQTYVYAKFQLNRSKNLKNLVARWGPILTNNANQIKAWKCKIQSNIFAYLGN